jgi:hypothetical protein
MAGVRALGFGFRLALLSVGVLTWPGEALGPDATPALALPSFGPARVAMQLPSGASRARLDVVAFGARGDGSTDDTRAIQAAIAAAPDGGFVVFPAGGFVVSGTLSVSDRRGLTLVGAGPWATVIAPTIALDGGPVIRFTNCRACGARNLSVHGNSSRPPSAAIESRVDAPRLGPAPSQLNLQNLRLGSPSAASLVNGIRFTAADGFDQNNDLALILNVEIDNFTGAGISIEHSNSLLHRIVGGAIGSGPVAVRTAGGSFAMIGTGLNASDVDVEVRDGRQLHPNYVTNVMSESPGKILRTTMEGGVVIHFTGYTKKGIVPGVTAIDFRSVGGSFSMTGSELNLGQRDVAARFMDAGSVARFTSSDLGITRLVWEGQLTLLGNRWYPGKVTESPGPRARLFQAGDVGGGYDPAQVRTLGGTLTAVPAVAWRAGAHGSVTIAGGATTAPVRFESPQPDDRYRVELSPGIGRGTPRAGSLRPYWSSKGPGGFSINLEAAPGEGSSVVVDWVMIR